VRIFQRKANDAQRTPPITSGPAANSGSLAEAPLSTHGQTPAGRARSGVDEDVGFRHRWLGEIVDAKAAPSFWVVQ